MKKSNMIFKCSSSEKGSAIVLALVSVAAISTIAYFLMNRSADTKKKIVDDARVVSYKNLVEVVRTKLYIGTTCTDQLKNRVINNASNSAFNGVGEDIGASIDLDLQLPMNVKILRKPNESNPADKWFLKGGTSIKDIKLVVNERVRSGVRFDPKYLNSQPDLIAAMGYILIIPDHDGVGVRQPHNKHYRIPIFLYYSVNTSNQAILHSCFEPNGEAYFCTTTAFGAYDISATDPKMRCHPQRYCRVSSSGVTSAPCSTAPYTVTTKVGSNLNICQWCSTASTLPPDCYPVSNSKYFTEPTNPIEYPPPNVHPFDEFNNLPEVGPEGFGYLASCGLPIGGGGTTGGTTGATTGGTTGGTTVGGGFGGGFGSGFGSGF